MRTKRLTTDTFLAAFFLMLSSSAWGACVSPPASQELMDQVRSTTNNLLFNMDARRLEQIARDVAATDATLAARLVSLAQDAKPELRGAIAAGLAQAALACLSAEPWSSQQIQQAVAAFQNAAFQALFAAVSGDLSTAATEAAASSATTGFGSVIVNNPVRGAGVTTPTPQGARPRFAPVGTFSVSGPSLSSAGRTAGIAVSPTQ